jgi:hypothetical protein
VVDTSAEEVKTMGLKERLKRMFGEPAVVVGLLQVLLAALVSWDQIGLTDALAAVILAAGSALAALYQAYITKTVALAVVAQAFNAVVALFAGFGLALTADQAASLYGVVAFGVAAWLRTQTGVAIDPGFHDEPVAQPVTAVPVAAEPEPAENAVDNGTPLDD